MATAPAIQPSRMILHDRGTWSAREDRVASAVWLGILWAGILAGFGTDFSRYLHEKPAPPLVVHVHAAVFSIWMLIVTAQVLLVLRNRVDWHMKFGWFAAGWVCLMAIVGPWAVMESQATNLNTPNSDPQFLSVNIIDLGGFVALLAWGIVLRKNPAAHKRMMILSMVSLADPGFSRFLGWFYPDEPHSMVLWFFYVFYGNILLLVLMTIWDWYRGRLLRSFVIGAAATLVAEVIATWLYFWGPWKVITHASVVAWANHFG